MSWSFLTCQDISRHVRINLTSTNSRPQTLIGIAFSSFFLTPVAFLDHLKTKLKVSAKFGKITTNIYPIKGEIHFCG